MLLTVANHLSKHLQKRLMFENPASRQGLCHCLWKCNNMGYSQMFFLNVPHTPCKQMDLGDCKMNYQERQQNLFSPPVAFLYGRDWGLKNQLAFFFWWATVRKMLPSNTEHHWNRPPCRTPSRCPYTWPWTTSSILKNKHLWFAATPENISQVPWEKDDSCWDLENTRVLGFCRTSTICH